MPRTEMIGLRVGAPAGDGGTPGAVGAGAGLGGGFSGTSYEYSSRRSPDDLRIFALSLAQPPQPPAGGGGGAGGAGVAWNWNGAFIPGAGSFAGSTSH